MTTPTSLTRLIATLPETRLSMDRKGHTFMVRWQGDVADVANRPDEEIIEAFLEWMANPELPIDLADCHFVEEVLEAMG